MRIFGGVEKFSGGGALRNFREGLRNFRGGFRNFRGGEGLKNFWGGLRNFRGGGGLRIFWGWENYLVAIFRLVSDWFQAGCL